jgi:hypothetical protein
MRSISALAVAGLLAVSSAPGERKKAGWTFFEFFSWDQNNLASLSLSRKGARVHAQTRPPRSFSCLSMEVKYEFERARG